MPADTGAGRVDTGENSEAADGVAGGFEHEPVMLDEVVAVLADVPDGLVVDATLGGGGHSAALLAANDGLSLLGIDRDAAAIEAAAVRLAPHGDRVVLRHERFDRLASIVRGLGHQSLAGVLFDLGLSSPQLDHSERGFSYRRDGPLDMRMDRTQAFDAADIVNTADERTLVGILRNNADERHAPRIVGAIIRARPITTTGRLSEVVRSAIPAAARRRGGHPARKTFQALRIEVNDELGILEVAIRQALDLLGSVSRCAVLSYHSGEDRIVKRVMLEAAGEAPRPRPDLPPPAGPGPAVRLLWRGVRTPGDSELARNPRARAARLRAVEKLPEIA